MDDKLQQIFCVQPNIDKVITYRDNTDLRKMIKGTFMKEMQNLLNVEMEISDVELKVPEPKSLPEIKQKDNNLNEKMTIMLQDTGNVLNVLDLI